jgi:hypothetical protein
MATNRYFKQNERAEGLLYADLHEECIKQYGVDVKYLPRDLISQDKILREDIQSAFKSAYTVEVYIESVDGFEGDGRLFSKFGLEIRDQATFVVSKRRWAQQIGVWKEGVNPIRPNEGDLIYLPFSKSLFEIKFVDPESPFFQLGTVPVFKLQCEMFEYSNEEIQTGDVNVDSSMHNSAYTTPLVIVYSTGKFAVGDKVKQMGFDGGYTYGIVSSIDKVDSELILNVSRTKSTDGTIRDFNAGVDITSEDGTVVAAISKIYTISDAKDLTFKNDPTAQNHDLEQEGDDIIDFSVDNPFGDPRD